jgi:hypothetical protein
LFKPSKGNTVLEKLNNYVVTKTHCSQYATKVFHARYGDATQSENDARIMFIPCFDK